MAAKVLLVSEKQLKDMSFVQLNVDAKVISRTVLDTQTLYLKPILGKVLFEKVITEVGNKIDDPTYVIPDEIKELLEDYIIPYLCHAVSVDLIINLTYRITNKGVLKYNDTTATSLSEDEIEHAKNFHDNRTAQFKANLIKFIADNKMYVYEGNERKDTDITTNSIGWYLEGGCGCHG